ncbi:hypothetical protein SAMN05192530_10913 [Aureimonas jatrophae]|uniref:Acetyltransferase (GNAT) family protein n=2 Tax=Aureimonas jatrophae TaxID=1166073 RepID=A0A1H0L274_9HYPH|nr:hypothetical protein SAMN05192530_10913 [Aureimonas jatrophae]
MRAADVPAVMRLADIVHPSFFEGASVFHDRLALFPEGQWVLPGGPGLDLAGYAVSYPARLGAPPPLDTVLGALPRDADSLYIHDVALAPAFRGRRLAEPVIRRLLALAGPRPAMLVSVYGTAPFWERFGFGERQDPSLRAKIASYGADAVFMTRGSGQEKMARD